MNQQVATQKDVTRAREIGMASGNGSKIAPQNLAEVVRFAEVMSNGGVALPQHLRGNSGACMAVTLQALEWEMNPFAVAQKSYVVNGIIAYEAQLIAAVVNTRSGIEGRLKYRYEGSGEDLVCFVTGKVDGEELEYESPRKADIKPQNSPLWKSDPKQQLGYYSARAWARRHTPEVILGVYDREEAQAFQGPDNAKDVTPKVPLSQRLSGASITETGEGFDHGHVMSETTDPADDEAQFDEIQEPAAESSPAAEAPEEDSLPSVDPSGAEDQDPDDMFPGDVETDGDQENYIMSPVESFTADLENCKTEQDVIALTDKYAGTINALSREDMAEANKARAAKLAQLKGKKK